MAKRTFDGAKKGTVWKFNPNDLVIIGLDTEDGPEHELYDERIKLPLDDHMVRNIKKFGVKAPITIRNVNGIAQVVNGRRRVIHAREANRLLKEEGEDHVNIVVPAVIEQGDETHMANLSIILNEIRQDDDILTKAKKARVCLDRNGKDYEAVAEVFGVTAATIKNWVKIEELSPKVKKAISDHEISPSAASQLHGLSKTEQVDKLSEMVDKATKKGKKKVTGKSIQKNRGKSTAIGKRILMKMVNDQEICLQLDKNMVHGIKLAIGERIPAKDSKIGKILIDCGYEY